MGCMVILSLFFTGCGNKNTIVNQTNSNTTEESVIQSSVENIQESETFAYVLNTEDTPVFEGYFLEFHNDEF